MPCHFRSEIVLLPMCNRENLDFVFFYIFLYIMLYRCHKCFLFKPKTVVLNFERYAWILFRKLHDIFIKHLKQYNIRTRCSKEVWNAKGTRWEAIVLSGPCIYIIPTDFYIIFKSYSVPKLSVSRDCENYKANGLCPDLVCNILWWK